MAQRIGKDGRSQQQRARLRCCASCEWIYEGPGECPKCGFVSYGARFVHGKKAYGYKYSQKPWFDRKMAEYTLSLRKQLPERPEKRFRRIAFHFGKEA